MRFNLGEKPRSRGRIKQDENDPKARIDSCKD